MKDIPLKEIMVRKVFTAHVEDPLSAVEGKFRLHGVRHLPVVDDGNRVVGIFTLRDLGRCLSPRKTEEGYRFDPEQLDRFILKHVMTKDPLILSPEDTLMHAVEIMARDKYGCIPIADAGRVLAGIVTQIDILKFFARWLRKRDGQQ
ncbi:MAG: CBS domain-containing protein [Candidatus Omnitrophica bacterium]|jgi:CBS domain-containing protein|nr:CBS domain-containing protein [Candidatus Omnitrophota bacterium]